MLKKENQGGALVNRIQDPKDQNKVVTKMEEIERILHEKYQGIFADGL